MNDINALRDVLFETLRGLQSKENPIDLDRAKAINDTAQTIINSAKVEVDFARVNGGLASSNFLPPANLVPRIGQQSGQQSTATGTKTTTEVPGATITQHRLR